MTEFTFSDRELRLAAGRVRESMLQSLPTDSAHTFSDDFGRKMEALLCRDRRQRARQTRRRRIIAALLALVLGASAALALNPAVRAAVRQWLREVYENHIVYRFTGAEPDAALPEYKIGWLPEGYEEISRIEKADLVNIVFKNKERDVLLVVEYSYMYESTVHDLFFDEQAVISQEQVEIHDLLGTLYLCLNGVDSSTLVWFDNENHIEFMIDGFLEKSEFLEIANHIG